MSRVAPAALAGLLEATAAERPRQTAIVHGDERVAYAALLERVEAEAAALAAAGVAPGDAVALLRGDDPGWVTTFFAIAQAGAVAVPLNPRFKAPEIEFCCRDAGVRAVASPAGLRMLDGVEPGGGAGAGDVSVVHYSSGSTGRPKRVPRGHRAVLAEALSIADGLALSPDDRILGALPLFHTYGMGCCLLASVAAGATLVLAGGDEPFVLRRERLLALAERERATVFPAVPFGLRLLAEAPGAARHDLSSLRLCLSAATALPPATFRAFEGAFGVAPRQLYGTTETGAISANLDDDPRLAPTSVGTPLPGAEVRVLGASGAEAEPGRVGDLAVRTAGMAAGYGGRPDLNRIAFRDGLFRPGDRGRVDEHGRVFVTGRVKRLIDVRGSDKVDPVEVEDVLAVHPAVREVVVVGAPGDAPGEEFVRAVVVTAEPCGERELVRWCRERLAEYKVPREVAFVDEIPRGPGGKVLRAQLV